MSDQAARAQYRAQVETLIDADVAYDKAMAELKEFYQWRAQGVVPVHLDDGRTLMDVAVRCEQARATALAECRRSRLLIQLAAACRGTDFVHVVPLTDEEIADCAAMASLGYLAPSEAGEFRLTRDGFAFAKAVAP